MNNKSPLQIQIPALFSNSNESTDDCIIPKTYNDVTKALNNLINEYNRKEVHEKSNIKNRSYKKEIKKIDYYEFKYADNPYYILKFSSSKTNLYDRFIESGNKKQIMNKNDSIGSEHNYILLYPIIRGIDPSRYKLDWIILLYDDPNKDQGDLRQAANFVLSKILKIKTTPIKVETLLNKLNSINILEKVTIKYSSLTLDKDNNIDLNLKEYLFQSKEIKSTENTFLKFPIQCLLTEIKKKLLNKHDKREISIKNNDIEYKIFQEMIDDANEKIRELGEEIYNYRYSISDDEINKIYNVEFVKQIFVEALKKFI